MDYIVTQSGTISAVVNGKSYSVPKDHARYGDLKDAVIKGDAQRFVELFDVKTVLDKYTFGKITIQDGMVKYGDKDVPLSMARRLLASREEGFPCEPVCRFVENAFQNVSRRSRDEGYGFLEHKHLPVTEDGCFLGYKRVKDDWTDFHTGKFDNHIGKVVEEERGEVDDDWTKECSRGLHVGTIEYVKNFHTGEGHVVIVKVNPKDIVSVPKADATKMRVCRYEVIGEYTENLEGSVYKPDGSRAVPPSATTPFDDATASAGFDDTASFGATGYDYTSSAVEEDEEEDEDEDDEDEDDEDEDEEDEVSDLP